ncbi:MAG: sugar translocase [Firmicutes bacterium]|nr:sugar translocase [Bacillota bacterium]
MKERSRSVNATINFSSGALTHILSIIISFIVRTIFIKMLSAEYLGVNGLFSNVLAILSFAELGIGNAIIYNMYKPIAEGDENKIKSLMNLYKKTYRAIGIFILIAGLLVIPFMDFIVKEPPSISENLIIIYLLFLSNTVLSYFYAYKRSLITGYQKEYVLNNYKIGFLIAKSVLQILVLVLYKNYLLYLITQSVFILLENIVTSREADKMYPYLKEKNPPSLDKKETKKIFSDVKALLYYKIGSVILNGTDNIIITRMLSLTLVGIVSNYTLIISSITGVICTALSGITSSIGNLNAVAEKKDKQRVFNQAFLIGVWIYGFACIELLLLLDPFIKLWAGEHYVLPFIATFALVLHTYINGIHFASYTYRTTCGLYSKGKYAPIIASILNIVLSIVLCKYMGLAGIFFATSIARLLTTTIIDPYLVYKYEFNDNVFKYFFKYISLTLIVIINYFICKGICINIPNYNVFYILLKAIVVAIISNLIFLLIFYKSKEFQDIKEKLVRMLKNLISKNKVKKA